MNDLVVDNVSKHYSSPAGLVRAVDGVTLSVPKGTSVAVMGRSGCGKSTLLGLIAGLEPPTAGRVRFREKEISSLTGADRDRFRRTEVGIVFQSDNLLPFLTANENVAIQLALSEGGSGGVAAPGRERLRRASKLRSPRDGTRRADFERTLAILERLGLADQAGALPDHLSGGQRQRVALARALVSRPALILADEPTGELDAGNAAAVVDLLLAAQRETAATMVVVTHDPAVAERMDRSVTLEDGRLTGA